jgi:hypothetical protein
VPNVGGDPGSTIAGEHAISSNNVLEPYKGPPPGAPAISSNNIELCHEAGTEGRSDMGFCDYDTLIVGLL